ncbi:MAG: hypothetical protein E7323_13315 [Clostridiales bacterium]|nr:hypothetical protein [Clostridiales bacterium]
MKKWIALILAVMMVMSASAAFAAVEVPTFGSFAGEEAEFLAADAENGLAVYKMADVETAINWANLFISEMQYAYDFETIQTLEGEDFYYVWLEDYTGAGHVQPVHVMDGVSYYVMCMVGLHDALTGKVVQAISPDLTIVDEFAY